MGLALHNYHSARYVPAGLVEGILQLIRRRYRWNNWSAHALLLGYMEAKPIYDAHLFNLASVARRGRRHDASVTAFRTKVASFLCPSDPNSGREFTCNYVGSMGPAIGYRVQTDSSGLFAMIRNWGLRDITDGSSNTVASSERLVGTPGRPDRTRGNGILNVGDGPGGNTHWEQTDLSQFPDRVLAVLQHCSARYQASDPVTPSGYQSGGQYWGWGVSGITLFNTLAPPNSSQYPWNSCRRDCAGCGVDSSHITNATSQHPGGCNVLMGDGRQVHQEHARRPHLVGSRHAAGGEVTSADSY
ncbi:MAG: DUF1559 domain-containing protein [Singulisphaera sp.]